ncbi:hypothetical protein TWF730_009843 [Orbilia blumenaviensis]|uniref:Semialdehyde dehydrogenase NAD-binding domain-containing protein n=1 Tax=Orbilia blumenaviensis TaxID=1796055 RepID=A0AAV9UVF8_9PEZI
MTKIFLLGATGYLGGTILNRLTATHPTLSITALARTQDKAKLITTAYPSVHTVIGDLDSSDVIISESSTADIIITAADCDHPNHIKHIYNGMAKNTSGNPIYFIHSSGTGVLADISLAKPGEREQSEISDKTWDDVTDIEGIHSLPAGQIHKNVDSLVQAPPLDKNPNIRYAIVCPSFIYGEGTGPVNRRSNLCPSLFEAFVKHGKGFTVGKGENISSNVHVEDIVDLYVLLVEEAMKEGGGKATWGRDGGWYFVENGKHTWGDVARETVKIAHEKGYLESREVEELGVEQAKKLSMLGAYLWGANSICRASRARSELGWTPRKEPIEETLSEEIETIAKRLGKSN